MKRRRSNNKMEWIVGCGFLCLFLICMLMMTYKVKQDMEEDYLEEVNEILDRSSKLIGGNAEEFNDSNLLYDKNNQLTKEFKKKIEKIIKSFVNNTDPYLLIDIGVFDHSGNLLIDATEESMLYQEIDIRTGSNVSNFLDANDLSYLEIDFNDYFSDDEISEIFSYYEKDRIKRAQETGRYYDFTIYYNQKTDKMVYFTINEREERPIPNTRTSTSVKLKTVFHWMSEDYIPPKTLDTQNIYDQIGGDITSLFYYPHLKFGEANYDEWKNNAILHDFQEKRNASYVSDTYVYDNDFCINYSVRVNYRIHSWQAAVDSLMGIYVYSAIIMGICLIIVLLFMGQVYRKKEGLEETRRDFTNAIAHEFKTPLTIVRGLVENMEEEESEEEKAFYQRAIVEQTEIMDKLVQEMVLISKLDSEKFQLQKNTISICSLIEEQMRKLECPVLEKKLQVRYQMNEDFVVEGDRLYLSKAFFNLLENAVSYNKEKGNLLIYIEKNRCMIENTADLISEEDLPHLCEMFFRGDKSRNTVGNHRGLGLYLSKRIFDMHDIKLKIENTDQGVRVIVS